MKEAIWRRIGPATGLLSVVLVFWGASVHGFPEVRPTDAQLANWLASVDVTKYSIGVYIEMLGGLFYLAFVVWLYGHLQHGDKAPSRPAIIMLAAAVASAISGLSINAFWFGMLDQAHKGLDIRVAQTLVSITQAAFEMPSIDGFLIFAAVGVLILRGRAMPQWTGWAAIALGVVQLLPTQALPLPLAIGVQFLMEVSPVAVAGYYTLRPPARPQEIVPGAQPAVATELAATT